MSSSYQPIPAGAHGRGKWKRAGAEEERPNCAGNRPDYGIQL